MNFAACIAVAVVAYLLGSIPTGYLVGRAKGIDLRAAGSGNVGATNALRILGKPAGIFVLAVDGLKGYAACAWACDAVLKLFGIAADEELYQIVAGVGAVLGHNFTCWLRFRGGKGVATSAGVYFALAPLAAGIALGTWAVVFAISRYVSVASIAAAIALPATVWLMPNRLTLRLVTTALALLVIWKHKSNIGRLLNGTEKRMGDKQPVPEVAK